MNVLEGTTGTEGDVEEMRGVEGRRRSRRETLNVRAAYKSYRGVDL